MKNFHRAYESVIEYLNRKLNQQQFLLLSSFLVGLTAGMAAVILKLIVHYIQELFTYNYTFTGNSILFLFFPMIGIFITVLIVRKFFKNNLEKGNAFIIYCIHKKNALIDSYHMYAHIITSAFTVGFGGSTGIESPILLTGSAIGSNYARTYQISYQERLLLIAGGTAAGIGAAFNAPIAGVLFAFEVLLASANVSAFIPIIIASATGAILSKIIFNESILLNFKLKEEFNYYNVPFYVLLAVICGFVSVIYGRFFSLTEDYYKRLKLNPYWKAVLGGLLIALLCLFFPPLFGEGYSSIKNLADLHPERLVEKSVLREYITGQGLLLAFMAAIFILKSVAVGVTLGTGGNGGNFAPSLFVGAFVGFSFTYALKLVGFTAIPENNFGIVAMAGVLSGIFHAPLTGIFLIAEITGGYELFVPLMIVSAISYLIARYFDRYSIDTKKLALQGIFKKQSVDEIALRSMKTFEVMQTDYPFVNENMPIDQMINRAVEEEEIIFAVVTNENKLIGIINIEQIKKQMVDADLQIGSVKNIMVPPPAMILENESMQNVMKKFDSTDAWILPVVDVNLVYKGFIMRNKIFDLYRTKMANLRSENKTFN